MTRRGMFSSLLLAPFAVLAPAKPKAPLPKLPRWQPPAPGFNSTRLLNGHDWNVIADRIEALERQAAER
jgi:hypothetical protein